MSNLEVPPQCPGPCRLLSPAMDHAAAIRSIAIPEGKDAFTLTSGLDGKVLRWVFATGQLSETLAVRPAHLPGQPHQ